MVYALARDSRQVEERVDLKHGMRKCMTRLDIYGEWKALLTPRVADSILPATSFNPICLTSDDIHLAHLNIIKLLNNNAVGLANPFPSISGALPCTASNIEASYLLISPNNTYTPNVS
jgi:hypothetical protein